MGQINDAVEIIESLSETELTQAIGATGQRLGDGAALLERLHAERKKALVADDGASVLRGERKRALAKGNDKEADKLDAEIAKAVAHTNAERDRNIDRLDAEISKVKKLIAREEDRYQVLNEDLAKAKTLEHQRRMDALYARADTARKIGEALIRNEYAQLSTKMVEVLTKLVAINVFIRDANDELKGTRSTPGDPRNRQVEAPNNIRRTADRIIPATTREIQRGTSVGLGNVFPREYVYVTEIEEVPEKRIAGSWRPELPDSCEIASAMEGGASWSNKFGAEHEKVAKRYQEIIDALL